MRQKLRDLHEIQKIDLEIREIEKYRESYSTRLSKLEEGVKKTRAEVESLNEQREINTRETKTLESAVHAESLKIRKWETRLNDIRNQREYLALSREVEGSKRANREAEEKILELMAQREEIDKKLDVLQDGLAEEEVDYDSEKTTVEREVTETKERVEAAAKRREALLPNIPPALMKRYEAIRKKRLGIGLVPVIAGCCQGCNMRLPPQLYNILQRGDSIEQCPSCQRIVFWDQLLLDESNGDAKSIEANP